MPLPRDLVQLRAARAVEPQRERAGLRPHTDGPPLPACIGTPREFTVTGCIKRAMTHTFDEGLVRQDAAMPLPSGADLAFSAEDLLTAWRD